MQDQEFQTILSQKDYQDYLSEKQKFKNYQRLVSQISQTNQQLQKQVKNLKRSFYVKKAQVKYLTELITTFINQCNSNKVSEKQKQDEDTQFQNLVESNINGLSSIQSFETAQQFQTIYKEKQFQLEKIQQIFNCSKEYYAKLGRTSSIRSSIQSKILNTGNTIEVYKKTQSSDEVLQELRPVEQQLEQSQKVIQNLLQQKVKVQKEMQIYKGKIKDLQLKISEYEVKLFNNKNNKEDKSYFIKLLIDQYNRDLQKNLFKMQMSRNQVDIIIQGQLQGISKYIQAILINSKINKSPQQSKGK